MNKVKFLTNTALYWVPRMGGEKFMSEITQSLNEEFTAYKTRIKESCNLSNILKMSWRVYRMQVWCNYDFKLLLKEALVAAQKIEAQGEFTREDYPMSPYLAAIYVFKRELVSRGW